MNIEELRNEMLQCTHCADDLPFGPNPIFQIGQEAKILIAGQAPGKKVHDSGIPFDDPSGNRLREWMGIDKSVFYDSSKIAILPMAFCYPGTTSSGDKPPLPACANLWRERALIQLSSVELTLCIGIYAHRYHLGNSAKGSLTETVRAWREFGDKLIPLPHPSPRNNRWLKKNSWFSKEVLPFLQTKIAKILD